METFGVFSGTPTVTDGWPLGTPCTVLSVSRKTEVETKGLTSRIRTVSHRGARRHLGHQSVCGRDTGFLPSVCRPTTASLSSYTSSSKDSVRTHRPRSEPWSPCQTDSDLDEDPELPRTGTDRSTHVPVPMSVWGLSVRWWTLIRSSLFGVEGSGCHSAQGVMGSGPTETQGVRTLVSGTWEGTTGPSPPRSGRSFGSVPRFRKGPLDGLGLGSCRLREFDNSPETPT